MFARRRLGPSDRLLCRAWGLTGFVEPPHSSAKGRLEWDTRHPPGGPGFFILRVLPTQVGTPFLRVFCEGPALSGAERRESEMPAPSAFDHVSTTNQIAHAASPPTLAKNVRMGHPRWEWCTQRSLKAATRQDVSQKNMSKRVDFAKRRRDQGRSLSSAVREITAMEEPVAHQHGINLQATLVGASARKEEEQRLLTERLQESGVPLFIYRDGQPARIGSCVLVRLDSEFYAFTAAHVIRDAGSAILFAPSEGRGGKLQPLPPCTAHLKSSGVTNDLDVGVLALAARRLGGLPAPCFFDWRRNRSRRSTR
jgi:hypothetical protein